MSSELTELAQLLSRGELVPYIGPGALQGVVDVATGEPMPAESESLILAMNKGRPMAPRLMWEFPRAAMDVELKRGRSAVKRFLDTTYAERDWTPSALHERLARLEPHYVVDINRDTQLQDAYTGRPHTLIRGAARIGGSDYRFRIHSYDGNAYHEVDQDEVDSAYPILFKPLGSPRPDGQYIASDADFVDYITELMGGFAIPNFLKRYRVGRRYLSIGLRLTRDTERMILSDIVYDAGSPTGWALIPEPTDKERRFCDKQGIEIVEFGADDLCEALDRVE